MGRNEKKYTRCLENSVKHIFKNIFGDESINDIYQSNIKETDPKFIVEIEGTLNGEIILSFPKSTLDSLVLQMNPGTEKKALKKHYQDIGGELTNLITGTFANQLQYLDHTLNLLPPEFNSDPIELKTFYDNISLSFDSKHGTFDIDLYYKEG